MHFLTVTAHMGPHVPNDRLRISHCLCLAVPCICVHTVLHSKPTYCAVSQAYCPVSQRIAQAYLQVLYLHCDVVSIALQLHGFSVY